MSAEIDPYEVLGVPTTATLAEIRAAYAAALQRLTPEVGGALGPIASAKLNLLDVAFRLLSQPEYRERFGAASEPAPTPEPELTRPETPPSPQPKLLSESEPPDRSPLKLGSGISLLAWIGLACAVAALGRAALGLTPAQITAPTVVSPPALASESVAAGDQASKQSFVEWKASDSGDPHAYAVADLIITLSTDKGEADQQPRPKIAIVDRSGAAIAALGEENAEPTAARFGVGKIDPQGDDDQVLFLSYSGGAHCCTNVKLLERIGAGWREKDLGTWDGQPLAAFPTDVDGDGVVDLVFNDQRFAYAFNDYADSYMPPRVFNVVGGRTTEVSGAPRYQKVFEAQLDATRNACLTHNNGACAAYVAIASRLGRRDEAWQTMLQAYDQTSTWILPSGCLTERSNNVCPPGQEIKFNSFPAALAWFLIDAGYPYWNIASPPADPNRAPSFDCSRVVSVNLKLICATPSLSTADRALASQYQADLLSSAGIANLQSDQRAWIVQRNNAPPDIDALQQLYDQRLSALRTSVAQQDPSQSVFRPNSALPPGGAIRPKSSAMSAALR